MSRVKGVYFSSFERPPGPSGLGARSRYTFKPGAQSLRQAKRNMRLKALHIIDSTDPIVISVGDRVIRSVCDEPDPEYSALHLFCAALDAHAATGEPWTVCMQFIMDGFDKVSQPESDDGKGDAQSAQRTAEPQGASRLRRLLRSCIPRPFRKSDEAAPEANIDQSAGAGDAPSA